MSELENYVVQKAVAALTPPEWKMLTEYFYTQFFNNVHVVASTPDLGKTYKFDLSVKNKDVLSPSIGSIRAVSKIRQLEYYSVDGWVAFAPYIDVSNFTDANIDTSAVVYNTSLASFYKRIGQAWIKLDVYQGVLSI